MVRGEVGQRRGAVGEAESGRGAVLVLVDPPAVAVALDPVLEGADAVAAGGERQRLDRSLPPAGLGDERPASGVRTTSARWLVGSPFANALRSPTIASRRSTSKPSDSSRVSSTVLTSKQ